MSQKVILMGTLQGSIPVVALGGSITKNAGMNVLVTVAGVSGAAKIRVYEDGGDVALAETTVTTATAITMGAGYGTITFTWSSGRLCSGDAWIYRVVGGVASPVEAFEGNRTGVVLPILVDSTGALVVVE